MRTRTLLLLAVVCGVAILLAGTIQLLRIAGQDDPEPPLRVGDRGQAGDAVVVVEAIEEGDAAVTVTITVSGVDDADGVEGFVLRAPNKFVAPGEGTTCEAFTVAAQTCDLVFPAGGLSGTDRQLVLQRAEESVRWVLA